MHCSAPALFAKIAERERKIKAKLETKGLTGEEKLVIIQTRKLSAVSRSAFCYIKTKDSIYGL
jgi:ribosomal protein S17